MSTTKERLLFSPVQFGPMQLKHRVVMAPLTRARAIQPDSVPGDLMAEYYAQRASNGGLIVSEATNISLSGRGWVGTPGLYSDRQIEGWKKVVNGVHEKGAYMLAQLWHTGRAAHVDLTGGVSPVSASADPTYWQDAKHLVSTKAGWVPPSPHRSLTLAEIAAIVEDYRNAAQAAQHAGFDGVEVHAANGYLIDQFLQDGSNKRTDEYGGPIENRVRLLLEVVGAVASVWRCARVGVRISPGGTLNGVWDSNAPALFAYVAEQLNACDLAYLHIIEPRVKGNVVIHEGQDAVAAVRLRKVFTGNIIGAGGFEPDTAELIIEEGDADAVAFGRHFLANPDLPRRIKERLPLTDYDRQTFYTFDARGYTDYPFYDDAEVRPAARPHRRTQPLSVR